MNALCPACGRHVRALGARFCARCGASLHSVVHDDLEGAPPAAHRSPLYWLYRGWRWLVFCTFLGCVGLFFLAVALPIFGKEVQTALCWVSALGAMFSGMILLAGLPGSIASRKAHPHTVPILICGWVGMFFTGGLLWLVALIWAFAGPKEAAGEPLRRMG